MVWMTNIRLRTGKGHLFTAACRPVLGTIHPSFRLTPFRPTLPWNNLRNCLRIFYEGSEANHQIPSSGYKVLEPKFEPAICRIWEMSVYVWSVMFGDTWFSKAIKPWIKPLMNVKQCFQISIYSAGDCIKIIFHYLHFLISCVIFSNMLLQGQLWIGL
jgi:hypothetical protein